MLQKEKKHPSLLGGVLLLTVANLGVKVIGLVFKIPLSHLLGDEGMGYFNAAYTIYSWLYIISTAGLPVAVSILISGAAEREDYQTVDRVFRVAMISFLLLMISSWDLTSFSKSRIRLSRTSIFPEYSSCTSWRFVPSIWLGR